VSAKRRRRRQRGRAAAVAACSTQLASDRIADEAIAAMPPPPRRTFSIAVGRIELLTGLSSEELQVLAALPAKRFAEAIRIGPLTFLQAFVAETSSLQAAE
jgi:hypothetical protein